MPAASAHVTVNPRTVQADSFARFAVRVPDEAEDAQTVKITVQLPESVSFVSFQPKPGWKRSVTMVKLAKPITNDEGETVTERIATVTWEGGRIAPGEFDEFGLSAKVPAAQGKLVFPTVQTYSNGDVVRWIGDPDSDTPAPRVIVTPRAGEAAAAAPRRRRATTADATGSHSASRSPASWPVSPHSGSRSSGSRRPRELPSSRSSAPRCSRRLPCCDGARRWSSARLHLNRDAIAPKLTASSCRCCRATTGSTSATTATARS